MALPAVTDQITMDCSPESSASEVPSPEGQESDDTTVIVAADRSPSHIDFESGTPLPGTPLSRGKVSDEIAEESRCGFIPGYSLLGRLGSGGMGVVYQAVQERLQRIVAVKLLTPRLCADPDAVEIFKHEAMSVARLNHPNIVGAYDYGEVDGKFYLVLEYIEGQNCSEAVERHGRFSETRAVQVIRDAVLGLSHALASGIIHRDVKPGNLMLMSHTVQDASGGAFAGVVKVTDLGLARMTETDGACDGTIMGTPAYMAPEQARGEDVDFRADIYALGATLYHLVTGVKPFESSSALATLERKQKDFLEHPRNANESLSGEFCLVLDRMMARKPEYRYSTYEALLADLQALLVGGKPHMSQLPREHSSLARPRRHAISSIFKRLHARHQRSTESVATVVTPANQTGPIPVLGGLVLGVLIGALLMHWILA